MIQTSKLITIDRFIAEQEHLHPDSPGMFTSLLRDITFAIRLITIEVRRAGLNDILGMTMNYNIHGEQIRRIDEYANEVIYKALDHNGHLCLMLSEENKEVLMIPKEYKKGSYVLAYDPLDGSTNMDVNITIGSIFSLYKRLDESSTDDGTIEDMLQPGYKQVAAAYALYGSSTIFVYSSGNGVYVFTYDPTIGEFLLTFENLRIPKKGYHYSCNEAHFNRWDKNVQDYLNYIKNPDNNDGVSYTQRYIATAVADIHRILHYGGIYLYPAEHNLPNGKIRLAYEANPLAFIIEQAGGRAITGNGRILETIPHSIHQTVPFYVGSPDNIDELERFLNKSN